MTEYERLIATGMNPECARDAVCWYRFQGDDDGLEEYVREVEGRSGHGISEPRDELSISGVR